MDRLKMESPHFFMQMIKLSDQQLLDYSGEHVLYEVQMLIAVRQVLPCRVGLEHNALLESFAIHLRNLIDFFYPDNVRPDDVVATYFFDDPNARSEKMPPLLKEARTKANKEMGHLTLLRKHEGDPEKAWTIDAYLDVLHLVAGKFVANASPNKLHKDVKQWVTAYWP